MEHPGLWDRGRPHDVRAQLFGGRGAVRVWDLQGAASVPPFAAVLACELDPEGSVGPHVQPDYPEIVVVLDGAGTARVGEHSTALVGGVVVPVPLGSALSLANGSSDAPLRYLIVKGSL